MQELNLRSLPTAPYDVSNAILPPPSSVENVVAPTQATTPDSSWLPSREILTPGTTRRCESIARPHIATPTLASGVSRDGRDPYPDVRFYYYYYYYSVAFHLLLSPPVTQHVRGCTPVAYARPTQLGPSSVRLVDRAHGFRSFVLSDEKKKR